MLGKSSKSLLLRLATKYLIMLFSLTLKEMSSLVNANLDYCLKKFGFQNDQNSKKSKLRSYVFEK